MFDITPGSSVLVLNSSYEPLNICSWKRAIVLLLKEKAHYISDKVIRLAYYIKLPLVRMLGAPTRRAIHKRDNHTCMYCGAKEQLTIDHVIPSSKGGDNTWENLTTACIDCNLRKGNKLLRETTMVLRRIPKSPFNHINLMIETTNVSDWKQYLY